MKPEEMTEITLYNWLINSPRGYIKEVYFNRINKINAKVFTTKGLNRKPDLIIKIDRGYGTEYCAVEVKSAESNKNIHDARKIMDYYENYVSGNTIYYIDEEKIKINHFLVASEMSLIGSLLKNDNEITTNFDSDDHWRKTNTKYNLEPKAEYKLTSMWVRRLWADFRYFRKANDFEEKPSVGILMSNFYENDFNPYIFIMNYNAHLRKPKWGARWWGI